MARCLGPRLDVPALALSVDPSEHTPTAPSPEKIGKTESHGCIRLTNWDALDLAGMVHRGTVVDFVG
jgi:hypothetical protein